jgi:hypothetical protein
VIPTAALVQISDPQGPCSTNCRAPGLSTSNRKSRPHKVSSGIRPSYYKDAVRTMEPVAYRSICIVPAAPVGLYLTVDLSSHWSASFVGIVVPGEVLVLSHQMGGSDHDLRPSWFPERDRCRAPLFCRRFTGMASRTGAGRSTIRDLRFRRFTSTNQSDHRAGARRPLCDCDGPRHPRTGERLCRSYESFGGSWQARQRYAFSGSVPLRYAAER